MSAHIIIAGGPVDGSGATTEDHPAPLPMRLRLAHFINPASVASTPHRQPAGYRLAGLRAGGRGLRVQRLRGPAIRTARIQFSPAIKVAGHLSRFERGNQPCRIGLILAGPAFAQHVYHFDHSIPVALASELHRNTGALADDGKPTARSRNLTARGGNVPS